MNAGRRDAPAGPDSLAAEDSPEWVKDVVFYGIDIARFFDANGDGFGDLKGVTEKLDYLHELGVTCLWLLPFFPSERGDNGYDITDFIGVDARFGRLDDFRTLAEGAHERGIRIMTDLVVHHTSSDHPWFQAAESDRRSRYVDYYIWSDDEPDDDASQSVFPQEEDGIWDYSHRAGRYYRHKFYRFQPDLRLNNDEVWDDVKRVMDFWIAVGVDGFRVDAATLMFADTHRDDPSFEDRFDDLRRYIQGRSPSIALLGEADVRVPDLGRYFENGRFNLLYDFIANNALYLSLARQVATPIAGAIGRLEATLTQGALLNFVRNFDELDLDQLTDDERNEVFDALAPTEDMRIYGRGIRRGWAPMMRNDDELRMTMSLLFALPGVPLLMAGHEIGMGDDLTFGGRDAVRLLMQWTPDAAGGFTTNAKAGLGHAAQPDGDRGYRRLNVQDQRTDPRSLWSLTRRLIALRAEHDAIGKPPWHFIDAPGEALLILRYDDVLALHNFSPDPQRLPDLPDSQPLLGADVTHGEIPGYGFAWLRSRPDAG
jgi:maltose alpha-D-glucosyltransferase/alpha-amylase